MIRFSIALWATAVCLVTWVAPAAAITCKECRELEKRKTTLQQEITDKETALQKALDERNYKLINDIRARTLELKKELLELRKDDDGCRDACRPDVVKDLECTDLRTEILKLEGSPESASDTAAIDRLYQELARCNEELRRLKRDQK